MRKYYFLNYKKFIRSGFHLASNIYCNKFFSYKYYISCFNNVYIIDLRHSFLNLINLLFFLQFYIKNFGYIFFFYNHNILDSIFFEYFSKLKQIFYLSHYVNGLISNKTQFKYLFFFSKTSIFLYFENKYNLAFLKEIWSNNIPLVGFGSFLNANYFTYIVPINLMTIKSIYFFSCLIFNHIKNFVFLNKLYFKKRNYFL